MIAFVGSVFSPYYKRVGRLAPYDHCAINMALYGPKRHRWAMTEYAARHSYRQPSAFAIGKSLLSFEDGVLTIDIDERAAPIPLSVRGQLKVHMDGVNERSFPIDGTPGRHRWQPFAPAARVEVDFAAPDTSWQGHAYVDCNEGDEPLEDAFSFWDWSRTQLSDGRTAILYNTDMANGTSRETALLVDQHSDIEQVEPPQEVTLARAPIWQMKRRTRADHAGGARIVKTLEDTPFYSRSMLESTLFGETRIGIHESISGPRLRSPATQFMLPFRMPRKE